MRLRCPQAALVCGFCLQQLPAPDVSSQRPASLLRLSAATVQQDVEDGEATVLTVAAEDAGGRLDSVLAKRWPQLSRTYFGSLCQGGAVLVGGVAAKKSLRVEEGQEIEVQFLVSDELSVEPEDIPLDILFEDEYIVAVNKPAGMVVHPAPGNWNGTFVNALLHHLKQSGDGDGSSDGGSITGWSKRGSSGSSDGIFGGSSGGSDGASNGLEGIGGGDRLRAGVVHRLDKGTTGVLLAAKTPAMQAALSSLFAERRVSKSYIAVCVGNTGGGGDATVIDVPIGRHPQNRQMMCAIPPGKGAAGVTARAARSVLRTAAHDGRLSVVDVAIETGRTHQIRVHMQHRGTPVLGDETYGNADWNKRLLQRHGVTRPLLHAHRIAFEHPATRAAVEVTAPLPADMLSVVKTIFPQVDEEKPAWVGSIGAAAGLEEAAQPPAF